jgi:hypothetical protein
VYCKPQVWGVSGRCCRAVRRRYAPRHWLRECLPCPRLERLDRPPDPHPYEPPLVRRMGCHAGCNWCAWSVGRSHRAGTVCRFDHFPVAGGWQEEAGIHDRAGEAIAELRRVLSNIIADRERSLASLENPVRLRCCAGAGSTQTALLAAHAENGPWRSSAPPKGKAAVNRLLADAAPTIPVTVRKRTEFSCLRNPPNRPHRLVRRNPLRVYVIKSDRLLG